MSWKKIISTIGLLSILSLHGCDIWGKESNYNTDKSYEDYNDDESSHYHYEWGWIHLTT